jgi:hypothetical protein
LPSAQIASISRATSCRGLWPAAAVRNFSLEIPVAHRIDIAAARRRLRQFMGFAVGRRLISTAAAMMENAESRTTSTLLRNASAIGSRAQASVN